MLVVNFGFFIVGVLGQFGAGLLDCNMVGGCGITCPYGIYARMIVTLRPFFVVAFLVCKRSINAGAFLRLSKMHNHP